MAFTPQQARFRFYDDDDSATSATESAAQDTGLTLDLSANATYQLRIGIQETGGTGSTPPGQNWQLQYSKNSAAWTNVSLSSSNARAFASGFLSNGGEVTVSRLTGATGTYDPGEISETGLVSGSPLTASDHTELIYAVEIVAADLSDGDTLDFRVLFDGAELSGGYTSTPTVTADTGVALEAPLLTNTQTFYSPTLSGGAIVVPLLTNEQTFYSPMLAARLVAPLLTNTNTLYAPRAEPGVVDLRARRRRKYGTSDYGSWKLGSSFRE